MSSITINLHLGNCTYINKASFTEILTNPTSRSYTITFPSSYTDISKIEVNYIITTGS